jgi:hypothetical protein
MIEMVTGEPANPSDDKAKFVEILRERGARFVSGMDHGYSHNFAVVVGALLNGRMYVLDLLAQPQLELGQKVALCSEKIKKYDPDVWADTAYPADNKTLKREAQLRIRDWKKGPGSVKDGISLVRLALMPAMSNSRNDAKLFFLRGDEGCELLAARMLQYHWTTDAAGRVTDTPDEENDDELDALRYMVMNTMVPKGSISFSNAVALNMESSGMASQAGERQYNPNTFIQQIIAERTGVPTDLEPETPTGSGKSGKFNWSL